MTDDAPVELVPYDPAWTVAFESERTLIWEVAGRWLLGPIEHVGSTAVPGLPAKPVVDIMAAVRNLDGSRPAIAALSALQYCYAPYRADVMHWFCKPHPSLRTHHLHLVPVDSAMWHEKLAFRDSLRANDDVAREYAALKHTLARVHRFDREAYTEAKGPFIRSVTAAALAGGGRAPV
jgi:GrpB-like predicted nucleotidyltransferase (UPF0157 family)